MGRAFLVSPRGISGAWALGINVEQAHGAVFAVGVRLLRVDGLPPPGEGSAKSPPDGVSPLWRGPRHVPFHMIGPPAHVPQGANTARNGCFVSMAALRRMTQYISVAQIADHGAG
jgi:hypothetical protein